MVGENCSQRKTTIIFRVIIWGLNLTSYVRNRALAWLFPVEIIRDFSPPSSSTDKWADRWPSAHLHEFKKSYFQTEYITRLILFSSYTLNFIVNFKWIHIFFIYFLLKATSNLKKPQWMASNWFPKYPNSSLTNTLRIKLTILLSLHKNVSPCSYKYHTFTLI